MPKKKESAEHKLVKAGSEVTEQIHLIDSKIRFPEARPRLVYELSGR